MFVRIGFIAQPVYKHVHDIGLGIETEIKNVLQNHGLGHDAAGVVHEIFQQRKLARLQFDLLVAAPHLAREQIQREVAGRQARRLGQFASPAG